jgi:hypothetical protein
VPLFFLVTALTAGMLQRIATLARRPTRFAVAWGRISLATGIPFGLTTMLVEFLVAVLVLAGVLDVATTRTWLTGNGAWFAATYLCVGMAWVAGLLVVAVRATTHGAWWSCVLWGAALVVLYGLPTALLVR